MKQIALQTLRYLLILACLIGAFYALLLARASQLFHRDTALSVAAAVRLQPHNSEYLDRLASWQPENSEALLKRAVFEDPLNYNAWIHLGFLAEMRDVNISAAEKYYLKAAEVNHMFLPRWTLANFYFRQRNVPEFLKWTKSALEITPYASDPVFAQLWQIGAEENALAAAIPNRPRILLQYVWFLSNNQQFQSIPAAVRRLVMAVGGDDPAKWGRDDLLAVAQDHMLAAGYFKDALEVWSVLVSSGWIRKSIPNAQMPITNTGFEHRSYRHAFDWALLENEGTRVELHPDTAELRISLSGNEAENLTLLQQYVPIAHDTRYCVVWQLQSEDLSDPTGLVWQLHGTGKSAQDLTSPDLLNRSRTWQFLSKTEGGLLTLEYHRPLGVTRARGSLTLRSVVMTRQ